MVNSSEMLQDIRRNVCFGFIIIEWEQKHLLLVVKSVPVNQGALGTYKSAKWQDSAQLQRSIRQDHTHTMVEENKNSWWLRMLVHFLRSRPVPKHIGFIMDGNRRFARSRNIETIIGHEKGTFLDTC